MSFDKTNMSLVAMSSTITKQVQKKRMIVSEPFVVSLYDNNKDLASSKTIYKVLRYECCKHTFIKSIK